MVLKMEKFLIFSPLYMAHVLWSTFSGEYKCDNVILIRYHVEQIGGHQGQHKHQHHGPRDGGVHNFFHL